MTELYAMPVIGKLINDDVLQERSKFAIFLDGDANNTSEENILDEVYFDNCYCYDQFMEDFLEIDSLRGERDLLMAELQKARALNAQLQHEQGNQ
jgi:hypothetical protein